MIAETFQGLSLKSLRDHEESQHMSKIKLTS